MAHQSLYRKYRPQTFSDVVGQEHITRTLRNAVAESAVAHAYLFNGPRGTGKTTTARILAKALDCEKGPTPDPDNTCEACRQITEGRHPDVYELDAASRTGVDAVRDEIITKVAYAATRGGWKVYIIDEVHMLSASAFNALLKTIEEPPPHTVFVLCTTHPHKVPETIHSRCQRFDFRRIGIDDIVGRLDWISQQEGIVVEAGVLPLIARHASGGMRDAISTLDQLAAFTGRNIGLVDVEGLLGEIDTSRLSRLADLVVERDGAGCFRFVAELAESGTDIPEFVRGLTQYVRDLYVVAASGGETGTVDVTGADMALLRVQAERMGMDRLSRVLDLLGSLAAEMRWSPDPRLALEVALTRMARPASDLTVEALAERVAALESGISATARPSSSAQSAPATTPSAPAPAAAAPAPAARPAPASVAPAPDAPRASAPAASAPIAPGSAAPPAASAAAVAPVAGRRTHSAPGKLDTAALRRAWPDVLRELKAVRPAASKAFLDTEVDLDGDTLVVEFAPERRTPMRGVDNAEMKSLLRTCVETVVGANLAVRYQLGRGAVRKEEPVDLGDSRAPESEAPSRPEPVQGASSAAPAPSGGEAGSEAERLLMEGFGAEVISEHPIED